MDALHGDVLEEELERYLLVDREGEVPLESQFVAFSPKLFRRGSQYLEYSIHLVEFTGAREDRHAEKELCHDASDGEDVALRPVVVSPQGAFRRAIPSRRDVGCVWRPRVVNFSRCTEINHLDLKRRTVDDEVLRLDVAVEKSPHVHEVDR